MSVKMFPIMGKQVAGPKEMWIPWSVITPHEEQAQRNHSQSLERLAERGGLSPGEALAVLEDRRWTSLDWSEAVERLKHLLDNCGTVDTQGESGELSP